MQLARRVWADGNGPEEEIQLDSGRPMASGQFSNVYDAVLLRPNKQRVAVKIAWPSDAPSRPSESEIDILSKLDHVNVARLLYHFEVVTDSKRCSWLVLSFMPHSVASLRTRIRPRFDAIDACLYAFQLWNAIEYVNDKGYIHLDIKPSNMLINDETGVMQLCDFGNARRESECRQLNPYQVTRFYRAPELLFGATEVTVAVDWWAASCVTVELATGRPLLKEETADKQSRLVAHVLGYPSAEQLRAMKAARPRFARRSGLAGGVRFLLDHVAAPLADLTARGLVYDPAARPPPSQVKSDRYFDPLFSSPPPVRECGRALPDFIRRP